MSKHITKRTRCNAYTMNRTKVQNPRRNSYQQQLYVLVIVLVGDSKAPGRSLSESTGLRPHAASVKIDRPIFALASGLKQLAKATCRSPGCLTRC